MINKINRIKGHKYKIIVDATYDCSPIWIVSEDRMKMETINLHNYVQNKNLIKDIKEWNKKYKKNYSSVISRLFLNGSFFFFILKQRTVVFSNSGY
jgi:hypothetical protein